MFLITQKVFDKIVHGPTGSSLSCVCACEYDDHRQISFSFLDFLEISDGDEFKPISHEGGACEFAMKEGGFVLLDGVE